MLSPSIKSASQYARCLEITEQLHSPVIVQDIRIHPFRRAFQGQLFDVVIRIPRKEIDTLPDGEDQFREDRRELLITDAFETRIEYRLLNIPAVFVGAKPEADCDEGVCPFDV